MRAIEPSTEADSVAILVQFLVYFGNVIGRNASFRVEANEHRANLFAVLVGQTAKGRKGTSVQWVRQLFKEVDRDWSSGRILNGLSSGEGLVWNVRDPIEKTEAIKEKGKATRYEQVVADQGVPDKRLLARESEFASVLKVTRRDGNTLSAGGRRSGGFWPDARGWSPESDRGAADLVRSFAPRSAKEGLRSCSVMQKD